MRENVIVEKALAFSIEIVKFCELLDLNKKYVVSKQLLRAGTAIGASVFEAQHAESSRDFIHKLKIATKEANETLYWLLVCDKSESYPSSGDLKVRVEELIRIISKIIVTMRHKGEGRFGN